MAPELHLLGGTGVTLSPRRYWIGVAALRHVARGRTARSAIIDVMQPLL